MEKQHIQFIASNHGTETIKVEQCDSGDPLQQLEHKVTHNEYAEFVSTYLRLAECFIEEIQTVLELFMYRANKASQALPNK